MSAAQQATITRLRRERDAARSQLQAARIALTVERQQRELLLRALEGLRSLDAVGRAGGKATVATRQTPPDRVWRP